MYLCTFCFLYFFKIAALSPCQTVHPLKRMLPTNQGELWQWFHTHNVTTLSPTKHCKTCDIYVGKLDPHPLSWKETLLWPHTVCLVLQCFTVTSCVHAGISYLTLAARHACLFSCSFEKVKWFHSLKSNWQKKQKLKKPFFCSLPRTWQQCTLHSVFLP